MNEDLNPLLKIVGVYLGVVIILAFVIYLTPTFSVVQTGTLGDTLGGILSPLIGGVTIYYVLKSYNKQRESYSKQQETHELEVNNTNFTVLKDAFNELETKQYEFIKGDLLKKLDIIYKNYTEEDAKYTDLPKPPTPTTPPVPQYEFIGDPWKDPEPLAEDASIYSVVYFYHKYKGYLDEYINILKTFNTLCDFFATSKFLPIQSLIIQDKIDQFRALEPYVILSKQVLNSKDWREKIEKGFVLEEYKKKFGQIHLNVKSDSHKQDFLDKEDSIRQLLR